MASKSVQYPTSIIYSAKAVSRLETALCATFAVFLFWKGILPAWRVLNTDFPNYYLVARLLCEGYSLDRIYDWIWLQRIKDHWGLAQPLVGFAGLTPFSALPIVPLSIFSAITAKRIWIILNLVFLAANVELLHRSISLGRRRIWLLSLSAVLPLRTSFLYGQMHLFVLFLLVLTYFFHHRQRELASGAAIAFAGALKVYPLAFVLYFLWKRQWRPALATLGTLVLIILAGGVCMGWDLLHLYAMQILPRSVQGEVLDPYSFHAASAAAFLHRLFLYEPALNPSPLCSCPALYAVLYPLWQVSILLPLFALIRRSTTKSDRDQLEWAAFVVALLVLSPVPSSYHFVVLILPAVLLVDFLLKQHKTKQATIATVLYLLVSVIDLTPFLPQNAFAVTLLGFGRLWLAITLYLFILVCLRKSNSAETTKPSPSRVALLAVFSVAILTIGILGNHRHFFHRQQELSHRIISAPAAYLATDPHATPAGYLFIAMIRDGYRVLDQQGHEAASQASSQHQPDQLSFTAGKDQTLVVELADANGSRITRVSDGSVLAEDAESPSLSYDGRNLAFIRERKGRGGLWIEDMDTSGNPPMPIIDDQAYDVRSALFLRAGALLFIAKHNGQQSLFSVTPRHPLESVFFANEDIGDFAISPDEHFIAATVLIHNRWQLVSLDMSNHRQTELTFGDCNAYSPAWASSTEILYATDCGRGLGLTGLASISLNSTPEP